MRCLYSSLFFLCLIPNFANAAECFDQLPGEENIPFDTLEKIKISKTVISPDKKYGYIATEYIGAANLQASIYIRKDQRYCFAGDLGALTSFKVDRSTNSQGYFGLIVLSKSGSSYFSRTFRYVDGTFKAYKCDLRQSGKAKRSCSSSEF